MAEQPTEAQRIARLIRDEADAQQERHIAENGGRLQDAVPTAPAYRRGFIDGLRSAADLMDEPRSR